MKVPFCEVGDICSEGAAGAAEVVLEACSANEDAGSSGQAVREERIAKTIKRLLGDVELGARCKPLHDTPPGKPDDVDRCANRDALSSGVPGTATGLNQGDAQSPLDQNAKPNEMDEPASLLAKRKAAANRRPGWDHPLHMGHMLCLDRQLQNRKMMKKIQAFDERWTEKHKPKVGLPPQQVQEEIQTKPKGRIRKTLADGLAAGLRIRFRSSTGVAVGDNAADGVKGDDEDETVGDDDEALFEIDYKVERHSSHQAQDVAAKLKEDKGRWHSAPGNIKNEFIVFALQDGPGTVSGIEFALVETMISPRRCRVQYSSNNMLGPWHEAWNFSVDSPGGRKHFKNVHAYGYYSSQFCSAISEFCGGKLHAWQLLSPTGADRINLDELMAVYKRLQQQLQREGGSSPAAAQIATILAIDPRFIFRECDLKKKGQIEIGDLLADEPPRPTSVWWRLLILDNWGSTAGIAIGAPLKLLSTEYQDPKRRKVSFEGGAPESAPSSDKARRLFEPSAQTQPQDVPQARPELKYIRRMSLQHHMSMYDVQEVLAQFQRVDSDSSGKISRQEFVNLLVRLFEMKDISDLSESRQEHLWRMAAGPESAELDFEGFLQFYVMATRRLTASMGTRRSALRERIDPSLALLGQALQRHAGGVFRAARSLSSETAGPGAGDERSEGGQ